MKLSVVIPVQDEEKTIGGVLNEVIKLNPFEIIVVVNGSNDRTKEIVQSYRCKMIHHSYSLGNDVGRAIGANHATGDIILFLDGDIIISYKELIPFISAIEQGNDIALNDLSYLEKIKACPHFTTVSKIAVNSYLQKSTLSLNSLLAVPHAIKREAIIKIGWKHLADPILAQVIAITKGLQICAPAYVDVIHKNRIRPIHSEQDPESPYPKTTSRIIGDHLRAISYISNKLGRRAGFPEWNQNMSLPLQQLNIDSNSNSKAKYSAILTMPDNPHKLQSIIEQIKIAGVNEIILIVNNTKKQSTVKIDGVITINLQGHYSPIAARMIGASFATADICLFPSSERVILAHNLKALLQAGENGCDIVLSNRKKMLDSFEATDYISIGQYFVNMAVKRPDLFNSGLHFTPFVIKRKVFRDIGYESFLVPPLAQIKAILKGYQVNIALDKNSLYIEPTSQELLNLHEILGDHVEALTYLILKTNERGGFTDGSRIREILK